MNTYNTAHVLPSAALNANITGYSQQLKNMFGYSIQLSWSGTPTGTFKLQGSSDPLYSGAPGTNPAEPTNWTDVPSSSQAVVAAGSYMWNISDVMYNWVRVVFTDGSGGASTALITSAVFNGKGV